MSRRRPSWQFLDLQTKEGVVFEVGIANRSEKTSERNAVVRYSYGGSGLRNAGAD